MSEHYNTSTQFAILHNVYIYCLVYTIIVKRET